MKSVWMKSLVVGFFLAGLSLSGAAGAAASDPTKSDEPSKPDLEQQLDALSVPGNQAPAAVTSEKLYAVQSRYSAVVDRHELSIGGAHNFSSDGYLNSKNLDLGYRYYLSNRWYLNLDGSYVFNELSNAGQALLTNEKILPDAAVTKYRFDLMAGYHLSYGKYRFSMDRVFYFDQYVALGPGYVVLDTGNALAAVADVGLAFWFGREFSMRVGVKDYFLKEQRRLSESFVHNFVGYIQAGYIFGG